MPGKTSFYFAVALPDGSEGHAVVEAADLGDRGDEASRAGAVAAALNFEVEGHGYEAVVTALKAPDGLRVNPRLF